MAPGRIAIADRGRYRIRIVDSNSGSPVLVIERPYPEVSVSDENWSRESARYQRLLDRSGSVRCNPPYERPARLPVLRSLTADRSGRIWIEVSTQAGISLNVIDPAGTGTVAEAPMPDRDPTVMPYVRADRLYLVGLDAYGVQSIMMYVRQD
jgi:hypothetical protein